MLFIAEIGLNYNGNIDLAGELIRQASWAGADIAKFQLGWKGNPGEINYIDENIIKKLEKLCDFYSIEFMVSIFNENAFNLSHCINLKRYKIASRTLIDNFKLVEKILDTEKETFISLGMWEKNKFPFDTRKYSNVKYFWCKSLYPTQPWDLIDLPKEFTKNEFYGYSDHSIGIESSLIAISRGALAIEKHFTLDKSSNFIRDHVLSATPEEFLQLTRLGRTICKLRNLGN